MEIGSGAWAALALGFLLGLKHATDADHVVAVATIVGDRREGVMRSIWVGASWGLGHSLPLLILGAAVLALPDRLMDPVDSFSRYLEFGVGVMLVALGALALWNLTRGRLHLHSHLESGRPHVHIHATHSHDAASQIAPPENAECDHGRQHDLWQSARPTFRLRSFGVGMVHGLAGTAAVMLALLPSVSSAAAGAGYLLLFGVGTVLSMSAITLAMSLPFHTVGRAASLRFGMVALAGLASLAVGAAVMVETASGSSFLL